MNTAHPLRWQSPQPLWARFGADAGAAATAPEQARPALLRFAGDDFMDRMLATLARDPARIDALIARPEDWRRPASEPADLMLRTPLPTAVQAAARATAARQPQPRVAPVAVTADRPLKLYQPAHQRHYLVSASLVCAQPSLPERAVAAGGGEQLGFVIRRLLAPPGAGDGDAALHEYAFVKDADGARWQRVGHAATEAEAGRAVPGEELLPLFPLAFADAAGRRRTLWSGGVPVGRREEYLGTSIGHGAAPRYAQGQLQSLTPQAPSPPGSVKLARVTQFQAEVAEPWKALIRSSHGTGAGIREEAAAGGDPEPAGAKARRVFDFNLRQQHLSWLLLLDLADYLAAHLPDLWSVIEADGSGAQALPALRRQLHDWLAAAAMPPALVAGLRPPGSATDLKAAQPSMRAALKAIRQPGVRDRLEAVTLHYDAGSLGHAAWPGFHFVLAGLGTPAHTPAGPFTALSALEPPAAGVPPADPLPGPAPQPPLTPSQQGLEDARLAAEQVDRLTALVGRALDDAGDAAAPPLPFALKLRNALVAAGSDPGWFVVRFQYHRVECGALHAPLLSAASARFQLASFFDADAPARPIRITLPADTSPAGLRKFNRNTAFVLSDMLCGQVQRAKGMGLVDLVRAVLPWPLHKDLDAPSGSCRTSGGLDVGMICSLSIPIITICALILLIIIVTLLDLVFRWLPFFAICFPVPGLKGKKP